MINKKWHQNNVMPRNATAEDRIKWHLEHSKNCGCRPIPESIQKELDSDKPRKQKKEKVKMGEGSKESADMCSIYP